MLAVRPKIAEMIFQVYGRSLHPELYETHQSRDIARGDYQATVQITSAGHVICWRYQGVTLTEIAAPSNQPLPQRRRLLDHVLNQQHQDQLHCREGVVYQVECSLERMSPAAFDSFQKELVLDGSHQGMLQRFDPSGRFGSSALSYINIQSRDRSMLVRALHTFPDDYAIAKSQSHFQLP